jgi:opacity protein-like surface antigen
MKKIVSALLISAAAVSAPAFAEGFMDGQVGSKYIAADIGSISYGGLGSTTAIDVGFGYQVHPAVAVEVDYLHGGSLSYASFGFPNLSYQLTAFQVMAVGNYNFGNGFGAYAKAGIAFNSQKVTVPNFLGGTVSSTTSSNDLAFAIGGKYNVANNVALRVQYEETGISSVNMISFGAEFKF